MCSIASGARNPSCSWARCSSGIIALRVCGVAGDRLAGARDVLRSEAGHLPIDLAHDGVDAGDHRDGVGDLAPRSRYGSAWRFVKLGARMCMRYGLALPSETR